MILYKTRMVVVAIAIIANMIGKAAASESPDCTNNKTLELDMITYEDFARRDPAAIKLLRKALYEKGIVGIKAIPGYSERVQCFIERAREFSTLPMPTKQTYSPNREVGDVLGFEIGKERFRRPDGSWITDSAKASYYALVPNCTNNKWPSECDLQTPFLDIGQLMFETGKQVMAAVGLIGPDSVISSNGLVGVGRMLHYSNQSEETLQNPLWCGAHFDHGTFTALLPAFYFQDGKPIPEPTEAGLFVRTKAGNDFCKVVSDDPDVLLFQVGEFGQLATDDSIKATEHRVHKAHGTVERYTMALFINPAMDTTITSHSELAKDARYGAGPGEACKFQHWHEKSHNRYLVKNKEEERSAAEI